VYLGVDLGGTNIAAGLVDDNFNIVYKDSIPTGAQREDKEIIYDMAMLCRSILENTGTQTDDVKWIGIGLPGTPDVKEGKSIYTNNINLRNTPVRDLMQKVIPCPFTLKTMQTVPPSEKPLPERRRRLTIPL
jgi:glucokinase